MVLILYKNPLCADYDPQSTFVNLDMSKAEFIMCKALATKKKVFFITSKKLLWQNQRVMWWVLFAQLFLYCKIHQLHIKTLYLTTVLALFLFIYNTSYGSSKHLRCAQVFDYLSKNLCKASNIFQSNNRNAESWRTQTVYLRC